MIFTYDKIRDCFRKNPFIGQRFAYGVGDGKEKAEQTAVPDVEKLEQRKAQARGEIDAIYESGKYATYNFRKLPAEFKSRMKDNFEQWIDANIAKYDKDKNSGINAAEYAEFKAQLNEKVSEILDRLIEVKEKKKKEAEKTKETAEQAHETQKRLEGINTDKLNEANLENEDGCYTELLSYQKDFEKEAVGFTALAGVFSGAKEQAENANKSHYTGITAVGEYLVKVGSDILPWVDDIPEVKSAERAKEKAIADFRSKLAEMKTRQKERQGRGSKLNDAPEKIRGKVTTQYGEAKNKTREELDKAKNAAAENLREKARLAKEIKLNEERKKTTQKEYDMLAIRLRQAEQRMAEVKKRTGEMKEAASGFESLAGQAQQEKAKRAPEPEFDRGIKSTPGKLSPDELAKQSTMSARKAREASGHLETGLVEANKEVGGMSGSALAMQKRLADLNTGRNKMSSDYSKRDKAGALLEETITGLNDRTGKLDTEEKQRIDQVDSLDAAIAETVIQVDTSNFELINKGGEYLKMLTSLDIAGPGLFDTAVAMFKGIPGVETAYNSSGDKLSNGWKWIKGVPVLGDAIEIVGYMGEGWTKAWDGIGDGLSWVGDKLHLQDAWDWMGESSKHLEGWKPIKSEFWLWRGFNTVLDYGGGMVGTVVEVFAGVTEGAKDLVKGIGMILRNPFDLIKGIGAMLNHPGMILNGLIQKDKWGDESVSKLIGRGLFDIITTCTGAGAAATGIKTSLAALQIGKLTFGKAILLGIETFGRTFIKDISAILKGVIMFTPNVIKGGANLLGRLASGGKKAEAVAGEMSRAAKMAKEAEEAYKAVEAVRGKPDEFIKLVRKNPHIMDLHGQHLKNLQREEDTAAKAKKEASRQKEQELAAPTVTINDQVIKAGDRVQSPFKDGETAYVRWSKGKYYLAREPLGIPFDTMTAFQLPTKNRLSAAAKRQAAEAAALARTAEVNKLAEAQKMAEVAPLVKGLEDAARQAHSANEAHIREAMNAALAKANHKGPFDMDLAVKQVRESVGRKVDKAVEEVKASKDAKAITRATKKIDELVRTTTERHTKNYLHQKGITVPENAVAAAEAAPATAVKSTHSAEVVGGMPVPAKDDLLPKAMTAERKALLERVESAHNASMNQAATKLGKKGYLDHVNALPTEELKMLSENLDNLDAPLIEKIVKQQYFILETEGGPVRYYVGKSISEQGGFGLVSECVYVAADGKTMKRGAVKMPFDPVGMNAELEGLRGLKNLTDDQRQRMARINEFLQNWKYAFEMDLQTNKAIMGMPDVPHLLRPVGLPKAGKPYAFIFPQIKPHAGRADVGLNRLMNSADIPPENILLAGEKIAESAEGILEHGYFPTDLKPGNVFMGTIDGKGVIQLGDLGLTKFEDVAHVKITGTATRFPMDHYLRFAKESFGKKPGEIPVAVRDRPVVGHMYKSFEDQFEFFKANPQIFPPSCRREVLQGLDDLMKRMKDVNDTITMSEVRLEFKRLRERVERSQLLKSN